METHNSTGGQLGDVERSQAYSRVFIMTRRACKQMHNNRDVEQLHALNTRRGGPQIREMVNLAMWSALRHTPGFS